MKKIITIIILSLMTSFAFAQTTDSVLKFLGIPVDGEKSDMIVSLEKKGFKYNPREDVLYGEFNGNESEILIDTNHNKVCRIIVINTNPYDEVQIKNHYNLLIEQFENNKKYFTFEPNTQIPENENISYEITVNKKQYEAVLYYNPIYNNPTAKDKLYNETIETCKAWLKEVKDPRTKELYSNDENFQQLVQEAMMLKFTEMRVWFTIKKGFEDYYLGIYYENQNNMANGEDL